MIQKTLRTIHCSLLFPAICILVLSIVSSCVTTKKTTYLQADNDQKEVSKDSINLTYRVQPGDNLFIRVITPDPRYAEMFNTLPVASGSVSAGPESVHLLSYAIQPDGYVHVPFLGAVYVSGYTIPEVRIILKNLLDEYISEPAISVTLVNNYVSILGDVNRPGHYPIYKEQMNIFQALAMAGDIGDFGNRYHVQMIRQTPDGTIVKNFDLTKKSIIDTEFFYVLPNDVIYAEPMKGKFFGMNTFPYALILSTITTTILLYGVISN